MKLDFIKSDANFILLIALFLFSILFLVISIRIFLYLLINILSKIYLRKKINNSTKRNTPKISRFTYKKDELLFRDQKIEEVEYKESLVIEGVEKINSDFERKINSISMLEEDKIIGIAKPVGFWTSLILGDNLSKILGKAKTFKNRSNQGFWVSMLEAQSREIKRKNIQKGM